MKEFSWRVEKNDLLKKERRVTFEDVVFYILAGHVLDVIHHPNQTKYAGQMIYVLAMEDYVYMVPFIETDTEVFLKTIIPSRKASKQYNKPKLG